MLVANRGEIAVRVMRSARELGLRTIAVFSDVDRNAPHVRAADDAIEIGPAPATDSYLRIDRILEAARASGAEAIHPGYGFLAENPKLAQAVDEAGLVFVGPPAEAIRIMGDKSAARQVAMEAGVPVVPGYDGDVQADETLRLEAERIGFPLLIKPTAGGGGKGMKRLDSIDQFDEAISSSRREARAAFGNDHLLLERFLTSSRHVEIQIFADSHGAAQHFWERECSIQRRHQKIIEEAPSPAVSPALREAMGAKAVALALAVGYRGAGTVEFLLAEDGSFFFLEMNTRLQVEHPVTEMITGIDLARLQLREAMGEALELQPVSAKGHSLECRIYAEDPANGFLPATGTVLLLREPTGPGVRFDSGISIGSEVGVHYDPILAKLVVHDEDRPSAIVRMQNALAELVILGVQTNLDFLSEVVAHPAFSQEDTTTDFVDRFFPDGPRPSAVGREVLALAGLAESPSIGQGRATASAVLEEDPYSPWDELHGFRMGTRAPGIEEPSLDSGRD